MCKATVADQAAKCVSDLIKSLRLGLSPQYHQRLLRSLGYDLVNVGAAVGFGPTHSGAEIQAAKLMIALVFGDETGQRLARRRLNLYGFDVVTAEHGQPPKPLKLPTTNHESLAVHLCSWLSNAVRGLPTDKPENELAKHGLRVTIVRRINWGDTSDLSQRLMSAGNNEDLRELLNSIGIDLVPVSKVRSRCHA